MRREPSAREMGEAVFRAEGGSLYVVATPIGNLRDVGLRALDILRSADLVLAEDTRVSAVLLTHYGIAAKVRALHEHNEAASIPALLRELAAGKSIAMVSDAGTPAISDPGSRLVRAALEAGHRVIPVPGPSAVVTAISAAGLSATRFAFAGFLPPKASERDALLAAFAALPAALVFFEAPHRVTATVAKLGEALGEERRLVVARELTKAFESIATMTLGSAPAWLAANPGRPRGEFVLIVDAPERKPGAGAGEPVLNDDALRTLALLVDELPPARAARVAAALTGAPRDALYARALALHGGGDSRRVRRRNRNDDRGGSRGGNL